METNLTIKNFRVFDEEGVSIDLKPITILTGCNSSGKSSMTKAILLLDSFLSQIKKDLDNKNEVNLTKYRLDFTTYPNYLLGNFNNVVHKGASIPKVTFEYSIYSRMLSKDVTVQLVFTIDGADKLNNGWLNTVTMSTDEGVFFSTDKENGSVCNFYLIKDAGLDFMIVEYLVHCYCGLCETYQFEENSKKEFEKQKKLIESELNKCSEECKNDVAAYYRTTGNDSIIVRHKVEPNIVLWSKEKGSLFMIPIIDDLNKLDKTEIQEWIDKNILSKASKALRFYTNKIIEDFLVSDFNCFGEYFNDFEKKYLEKCRINTLSLKDDWRSSDFLSSLRSFFIWGNKDNCNENIAISFDLIYEAVMLWNGVIYKSKNSYYQDLKSMLGSAKHTAHFMIEDLMKTFVYELMLETLVPEWCGKMAFASSSHSKIKKLYALEEEDETTKWIKKYFEEYREFGNETNDYHKDKKYVPESFMNNWVKKFGIGERISLDVDEEGLGIKIRLHKLCDEKDKGTLLAYEGDGITQLFSILLQIETIILSAKGELNHRWVGLDDLDGYKSNEFYYETRTLLIEEPELRLHPALQSQLADMIVDAYKNYNIHFIVETHSEYLIRKLQVLVAEGVADLNKISLNYLDSPNVEKRGAYTPQLKSIAILSTGRLADKFGEGFFDEAGKLNLVVLRNERRAK